MRFVDEFRDGGLARDLAESIRREVDRPIKLMEVCGTHTMAIARYGIKSLLPENLKLISGPGCPVCVTPQTQIDSYIALGRSRDTILATFGDMVRVPGSVSTLEKERAAGADVRVVYSPMDAVSAAEEHPDKRVVFFGVGFETTTPAVALAIVEARNRGLANFHVLCAHKTIPPAMSALAGDPDVAIDGFICPGHVSTIIGGAAYEPVARDCGIPCVIAGFEPLDVLQAVLMLVRQAVRGRSEVEVQYSRAVSQEGNPAARECVAAVFEPADAEWRGIGMIPSSGLRFRLEFAAFDADRVFGDMRGQETRAQRAGIATQQAACECGSVLKGLKSPQDCLAFGSVCTPENPLGPCMVSSEGACAAEYRYGERH